MKEDLLLSNYSDPIAKIWGSAQPELPVRKIRLSGKKAKAKKR